MIGAGICSARWGWCFSTRPPSTLKAREARVIGQYGHSKDHRPDLRQMVVGIALDVEGRPICCEMWPGNTADVKTLVPVVERMRAKFRVREICVVADRGMVSEATMAAFERDGAAGALHPGGADASAEGSRRGGS